MGDSATPDTTDTPDMVASDMGASATDTTPTLLPPLPLLPPSPLRLLPPSPLLLPLSTTLLPSSTPSVATLMLPPLTPCTLPASPPPPSPLLVELTPELDATAPTPLVSSTAPKPCSTRLSLFLLKTVINI